MNYAVIQNNTVINVIVWDGNASLSLPDGCTTMAEADAQAAVDAGTLNGSDYFYAPIPDSPPESPPS